METMTLNEYVESLGRGGQVTLASALGCSPGLVWQWLNGKRPVSGKMARKIECISEGRVKKAHLCPDLYGEVA